MSFDALTIGGMLVAILTGGFLVGVVSHNDSRRRRGPHEGRTGEGLGKRGS